MQTDGAEHRDILQSLVFQSGGSTATTPSNDTTEPNNHNKKKRSTKKRKREAKGKGAKYKPNTIPSWARIHNPAFVQSIAVVEFCIDGDGFNRSSSSSDDSERLMPSFRIRKCADDEPQQPVVLASLLLKDGYEGRKAIPFNMKISNRDRPRHVTDVLMYIKPAAAVSNATDGDSTSKGQEILDDDKDDKNNLISLLRPLMMSRKDRKRERNIFFIRCISCGNSFTCPFLQEVMNERKVVYFRSRV